MLTRRSRSWRIEDQRQEVEEDVRGEQERELVADVETASVLYPKEEFLRGLLNLVLQPPDRLDVGEVWERVEQLLRNVEEETAGLPSSTLSAMRPAQNVSCVPLPLSPPAGTVQRPRYMK